MTEQMQNTCAHSPVSSMYMSDKNEFEASSPPKTMSLEFHDDIEWLSLGAGWFPVVGAFLHTIVAFISNNKNYQMDASSIEQKVKSTYPYAMKKIRYEEVRSAHDNLELEINHDIAEDAPTEQM